MEIFTIYLCNVFWFSTMSFNILCCFISYSKSTLLVSYFEGYRNLKNKWPNIKLNDCVSGKIQKRFFSLSAQWIKWKFCIIIIKIDMILKICFKIFFLYSIQLQLFTYSEIEGANAIFWILNSSKFKPI